MGFLNSVSLPTNPIVVPPAKFRFFRQIGLGVLQRHPGFRQSLEEGAVGNPRSGFERFGDSRSYELLAVCGPVLQPTATVSPLVRTSDIQK